jgi:hypothetical protein
MIRAVAGGRTRRPRAARTRAAPARTGPGRGGLVHRHVPAVDAVQHPALPAPERPAAQMPDEATGLAGEPFEGPSHGPRARRARSLGPGAQAGERRRRCGEHSRIVRGEDEDPILFQDPPAFVQEPVARIAWAQIVDAICREDDRVEGHWPERGEIGRVACQECQIGKLRAAGFDHPLGDVHAHVAYRAGAEMPRGPSRADAQVGTAPFRRRRWSKRYDSAGVSSLSGSYSATVTASLNTARG